MSGRAAALATESASVSAKRAVRSEIIKRTPVPVESHSSDVQLARMKELRRDVVRAMGTIFFQYLPDDLLRRLIENPPKTVLELRDDFEVHAKIIENFGTRIVHLASAPQARKNEHPIRDGRYERAAPESLEAASCKFSQQAPRAKVAAAREVAGGKVGALHGRAVEARFERLRTLRLELARKNRWPAYCVLQDETLLEIARTRPKTMRELLEIKGMGPKRAEHYGKELLAEVARE
jgi:superfamily II DNA helicase RecQ